MSKPRTPGERLLSELRRELLGTGARRRRRTLREARDHLLCAVEDEIARGRSPRDAEEHAAERFGDPIAIAARLRSTPRRRTHRAVPVAVGVAMLTGVLALPAGPVRENLAAQPAKAAAVPAVSTARCLKAWNGRENAHWRAYAVGLGTHRAWVGGAVAINQRGVVLRQMCVVKLWLAARAGHWQNAVYVYGSWDHGAADFGTSWKHTRVRPHRARQRTTVQWSNARVQPDGHLRPHAGTSA